MPGVAAPTGSAGADCLSVRRRPEEIPEQLRKRAGRLARDKEGSHLAVGDEDGRAIGPKSGSPGSVHSDSVDGHCRSAGQPRRPWPWGDEKREAYRESNPAERSRRKAKQFRRLATCYDKLASSYLAFVQFASLMILIR